MALTKPQTRPGSKPIASAAASPVDCRPITTEWPSSKACWASLMTQGICTGFVERVTRLLIHSHPVAD